MANQKGILFGRGASGKLYKTPVTIVDTDGSAATWTAYGASVAPMFPEPILWFDLQTVAAVATITRVDITINGTTYQNTAILAASLANQTTSPATRFGDPVPSPAGALIQLLSHT